MQAASSRTHQSSYLPYGRSYSPSLLSLFNFHQQVTLAEREEQGANELALLALLLLRLPLLLTLQN